MAILANSSITLIHFKDAYGAALEGDYEGSEEEFNEALAGLEGTLSGLGVDIEELGFLIDEVKDIAEDQIITPSEKVSLIALIHEITRETEYLLSMLDGESAVAINLSDAKLALVNQLEAFVAADDYSDVDLTSYSAIHNAFVLRAQAAYAAIETMREEGLIQFDSDITARYAQWVTKINDYTETIDITSGDIIMKVNGQIVMKLAQNRLSFYSGGEEVSYFANQQMMIENAMVIKKLHVGNHIVEKHTGNEYTIFKYNG